MAFSLGLAPGRRYPAPMMSSTARRLLTCAALSTSLWGSTAFAGQIVVLDETWVHAPDLADSHYRVAPIEGTPGDWVNPVDYSQGKAYVYLEVHSKPTDQPTKFQVCFEATPTYACTAQSPTYTTVGTYEWETNFSDFWSPPNEFVDWTKGVNKIACILKDTMNGKPSADNVGPEVAALYTPTEVRMVVTIVEPGSEYVPPTPSGEGSTGGESTAGDDGTAGDTSSSGGPSDDTTGAPDTTGTPGDDTTGATDPTGAPDPTTTGEQVTSGAGGSAGDGTTTDLTGPTGPTGGASETTGDPGHESSGGCACSSSGGDAPVGVALGLVVLGLVRRRRG